MLAAAAAAAAAAAGAGEGAAADLLRSSFVFRARAPIPRRVDAGGAAATAALSARAVRNPASASASALASASASISEPRGVTFCAGAPQPPDDRAPCAPRLRRARIDGADDAEESGAPRGAQLPPPLRLGASVGAHRSTAPNAAFGPATDAPEAGRAARAVRCAVLFLGVVAAFAAGAARRRAVPSAAAAALLPDSEPVSGRALLTEVSQVTQVSQVAPNPFATARALARSRARARRDSPLALDFAWLGGGWRAADKRGSQHVASEGEVDSLRDGAYRNAELRI